MKLETLGQHRRTGHRNLWRQFVCSSGIRNAEMEPGDEGFGASREQETKGQANELIKRTQAAETETFSRSPPSERHAVLPLLLLLANCCGHPLGKEEEEREAGDGWEGRRTRISPLPCWSLEYYLTPPLPHVDERGPQEGRPAPLAIDLHPGPGRPKPRGSVGLRSEEGFVWLPRPRARPRRRRVASVI